MRREMILLSCVLMIGLVHPLTSSAGGLGNATPATREAMLAHICTAGPNKGQPCTVQWDGPGNPYGVVSEDCPGACVIDYESEPFDGDFYAMIDEDVTDPQDSETVLDVPIVTALLCVEKKEPVLRRTEDLKKPEDSKTKEEKQEERKRRYCITKSYRPQADGSGFVFGGVSVSNNPTPEEQLVSRPEQGTSETEPGKETMLLDWKFGLFEVLTPDSDLTQALRDLYKKTGVVTVTDINHIGTDDHVDDTTGSVLRFRMTLRFVKAPPLERR